MTVGSSGTDDCTKPRLPQKDSIRGTSGKGRENDAEHERKAERDTVSVRRLARDLDGNGIPEPTQQAHEIQAAHPGTQVRPSPAHLCQLCSVPTRRSSAKAKASRRKRSDCSMGDAREDRTWSGIGMATPSPGAAVCIRCRPVEDKLS